MFNAKLWCPHICADMSDEAVIIYEGREKIIWECHCSSANDAHISEHITMKEFPDA